MVPVSLADVQVVLFDAVGTLMAPDPPAAEAYHHFGKAAGSPLERREVAERFRVALRAHGAVGGRRSAARSGAAQPSDGEFPTSERDERARWRRVVRDVFRELEDSEALFERLWRHFGEASSWRLYDDVAPALERLQGKGVRLGIASNFDDRLRAIWEARRELQRCRDLFCSSEIGYAKPSRRFYAEVTRRLDVKADQVLMVGDDLRNDVEGARAAGLRAVLLDRNAPCPAAGRVNSLELLLEAHAD